MFSLKSEDKQPVSPTEPMNYHYAPSTPPSPVLPSLIILPPPPPADIKMSATNWPVELKASLPGDFFGESEDIVQWILSLSAYFSMNKDIYDNATKILTVLNKMSKGRGKSFPKGWYYKLDDATYCLSHWEDMGKDVPSIQKYVLPLWHQIWSIPPDGHHPPINKVWWFQRLHIWISTSSLPVWSYRQYYHQRQLCPRLGQRSSQPCPIHEGHSLYPKWVGRSGE